MGIGSFYSMVLVPKLTFGWAGMESRLRDETPAFNTRLGKRRGHKERMGKAGSDRFPSHILVFDLLFPSTWLGCLLGSLLGKGVSGVLWTAVVAQTHRRLSPVIVSTTARLCSMMILSIQ